MFGLNIFGYHSSVGIRCNKTGMDCLSTLRDHYSLAGCLNSPKPVLIVGGFILSFFAAVKMYKLYQQRKKNQRRLKWSNVGQDKVILHQFNRGGVTPSPSPFVLKLETYLRMAGIPYENDFEEPFGAKGKTPWITLNGEEYCDSQLCIELLGQKFKKNLSSHLSASELSVARSFQVMTEEHLFWVLVLWRFVYNNGKNVPEVMPALPRFLIPYVKRLWKKAAHGQGMGRHTEAEAIEIGAKDLRAISSYLGTKPYFMGDTATEVDCAIFGMMAMVLWTMPVGYYYRDLMDGELSNLKNYCERMKAEFWPDWDQCLYYSKKKA